MPIQVSVIATRFQAVTARSSRLSNSVVTQNGFGIRGVILDVGLDRIAMNDHVRPTAASITYVG